MLASNGIKLFDLHFLRHRTLVLGGSVEMTGTCGRFQLDLVAHGYSLIVDFVGRKITARREHAGRPKRRQYQPCRWCF